MSQSFTSGPRIAIVGAGPAGLTLCRLLYIRGIKSVVFELREKPTEEDLAKPSGSLDLHEESGLSAIRHCGLWGCFTQLTGECSEAQKVADKYGLILHEDDGDLSQRPEISRHALTKLLVSSIPSDWILWGHKLLSTTEIQTARDGGRAVELDFGAHGKHLFDFVIGADGAWSKVRNILTEVKPHYVGIQSITLTIRQLTTKYPNLDALIGRGSFSALGLRHAVMSQRGTQDSARIYVFLTTSDEQAGITWGLANEPASAAKEVLLNRDSLLGSWGPMLKCLVAIACDEESSDNPGAILDIRPLFSLPVGASWEHNPSATLVGDAAHLMCPWAGEGVNLAMWDSLLLADTMAEAVEIAKADSATFSSTLSPLLKMYEQNQMKRAREKAEETEANGQMLFAENGAEAFAQFFHSVLGSLPEASVNMIQHEVERPWSTEQRAEEKQHIDTRISPTVGESQRHAASLPKPKGLTGNFERPQERLSSPRELNNQLAPQDESDQKSKSSFSANTQRYQAHAAARGLDSRGNIAILDEAARSFECQRVFNICISGNWPDVDWRKLNGRPQYLSAICRAAVRAICGQRFGKRAPLGQECNRCREGRGPFETCKITYLPEISLFKQASIIPGKALFGGSCMACGINSRRSPACSLRHAPVPPWIGEYFQLGPANQMPDSERSRKRPASPELSNAPGLPDPPLTAAGPVTNLRPPYPSALLASDPRDHDFGYTYSSQENEIFPPLPGF